MDDKERFFRDLHARSIREDLTADELALVAAELKVPQSSVSPIVLLLTLGETEAREYASLVEAMLDPTNRPDVAAVALQVLVLDWDLGARYRDQLRELIRGAAWDIDGDLRLRAVACAGSYLRRHRDPEVAKLVASLGQASDSDNVLRASALFALGEALGDRWARGGFSLEILKEQALVDDMLKRSQELLREN